MQPCWLYATTNSALATTTLCTTNDSTPGNILDLQYNFNLGAGDNGNVMGIANNRDNTRSQVFTYDTLNRLVLAGTAVMNGSNCWGEAYHVDVYGNLWSITPQEGYAGCTEESGMSISQGTSPFRVSGWGYDLAGNTTNDGVNTYTWNAESEMSSANGSVNYTYDGDGNRLEKSSGTMYWYGSGTEILDESDTSGNVNAEYVFFGGKRVAMDSVTGTGGGSISSTYYYVGDFLGSSRTMVQAGATSPCYDADFYPYGGERDVVSSCNPVYKFEGKERDSETQNDDFGARYYSWRFGRWLSADWSSVPVPVPYANLTNPQTLNLYAMVRDNPETFADLDGHECWGSAGTDCRDLDETYHNEKSDGTPCNLNGETADCVTVAEADASDHGEDAAKDSPIFYADDYNVDMKSHGAPHIDRIDKNGKMVGRYDVNGNPIKHGNYQPGAVPNSDKTKFQKALEELRKKTGWKAPEEKKEEKNSPQADPNSKSSPVPVTPVPAPMRFPNPLVRPNPWGPPSDVPEGPFELPDDIIPVFT